jgi:hypothetical protein
VPRDYRGTDATLTLEPAGPWRVSLGPYPFAESPATFRLVRRLLPKSGDRRDGESFRREFAAAVPEDVEITIEPR